MLRTFLDKENNLGTQNVQSTLEIEETENKNTLKSNGISSSSSDFGGFQLEFVSISQDINHMTCYNLSALIG